MLSALALITFRQWRLHKLRVALTLLSVALGVAVFFAVRTANTTLVSSLQVTIEKLAGRATLQVVGAESGLPQDVIKTVRETPGVKLAEPVTETIAQTTLPGAENLLVLGLDMGSDLKIYEGTFDESNLQISNPLAFTSRADSIAVSRAFADRYNLKEGDSLPLYTQYGRQNFTVRGFFEPIGAGAIFGGNIGVMDISAAQAAYDRGAKFDRIDIMTDPQMSVDVVQQNRRALLPAGLDVTRPQHRGQDMENAVASMSLALSVMSFLALIVGGFIIFNSLNISVSQRWKEIGNLRALGVERRNVQRMFLCEAAVIGLIGSAVGVIVGFFLAYVATKVMSAISVTLYGYVSTPQLPAFRWGYAASAFAVGLLVTVLAAWLPAREASRLEPILILHNIETRQGEVMFGWLHLAIGLAFIFSGITLTYSSSPRVNLLIQCMYSAMVQFGMILLLPKFIVWCARGLRPVGNQLFGAEGVIAVDTIARTPRRTSATVGALMIGLSFVYSIGAFIGSHKEALNRVLDRAVNADLLITTSEQMRSRTYHFTEELARRVGMLPGVEQADNVRVMEISYGSEGVVIIARDMNAWFASSPNLLDEGGAQAAREVTARGEGFLISRNFSLRSGVRVGDPLQLETPTGTLIKPVVGILEYYYAEKGTVFFDRELYKKFWRDDAVDYIALQLKPEVSRAAFKTEVQRVIAGAQRAFIYTHEEYKQWVNQLTDQFFTLTYLQMVIAIVVAALGIINTLVISIAERQRELGIIRAIGGLRGQVRKMILLEAILISFIGIAAGVVASAFSAYFMVRTAAIAIAGFTLQFHFPLTLVLVTFPVVLTVTLVAAWLPAQRAMRMRVAEAISYE